MIAHKWTFSDPWPRPKIRPYFIFPWDMFSDEGMICHFPQPHDAQSSEPRGASCCECLNMIWRTCYQWPSRYAHLSHIPLSLRHTTVQYHWEIGTLQNTGSWKWKTCRSDLETSWYILFPVRSTVLQRIHSGWARRYTLLRPKHLCQRNCAAGWRQIRAPWTCPVAPPI